MYHEFTLSMWSDYTWMTTDYFRDLLWISLTQSSPPTWMTRYVPKDTSPSLNSIMILIPNISLDLAHGWSPFRSMSPAILKHYTAAHTSEEGVGWMVMYRAAGAEFHCGGWRKEQLKEQHIADKCLNTMNCPKKKVLIDCESFQFLFEKLFENCFLLFH